MKQILTLFMIFLAFSLAAQTTQPGIVQEYNEKEKKTPLSGVELNVRSANNTISDKDGTFSLNFLTAKAGDKVNVRSIVKEGYEIFNKEAVEQWNINPTTPFSIVMCRSEKFKAICDNYYSKASINYKNQYEKEIATINNLKKSGKIKEAEYQQKIIEIQNNYDLQLDNLDNYVDRFARIDLSLLQSEEQEIIELLQNGLFDEAISKYEELKLSEKFVNICKNDSDVVDAIAKLTEIHDSNINTKQSLLEALYREIDMLLLSGRKENKEKAIATLLKIVDADPNNRLLLANVANIFRTRIFDSNRALDFFQRAMSISEEEKGRDNVENANLCYAISKCFKDISNNDKELEYLEKALCIYRNIYGEDSAAVVDVYLSICDLQLSQGRFSEAYDYLEKAFLILKNTNDLESGRAAESWSSLGKFYSYQGLDSEALDAYITALKIWESLGFDNMNHDQNAAHSIIIICHNLGEVFSRLSDYESAIDFINISLGLIEKHYGKNNPEVAHEYLSLGTLYSSQGNHQLALDYLNKALKIFGDFYGENHKTLLSTYRKIAQDYHNQQEYDEALKNYEYALQLYNKSGESSDAMCGEISIDMAYSLIAKKDYENAVIKAQAGLEILESVLQSEDLGIADAYYVLSEAYYYKKDYVKALESAKKTLQIMKNILGENNENVADLNLHIGKIYMSLEEPETAILHFKNALPTYQKIIGDKSVEKAHCLYKIGNALYLTGQYSAAIDYFDQCIDIYKIKPDIDWNEIFDIYSSIGLCYSHLNNDAKAIEYLSMAIQAIPLEFSKTTDKEYYILRSLGNRYFDTEDYMKAIRCYEDALVISKLRNYDESFGILPPLYNSYHYLKDKNNTEKEALLTLQQTSIPIITIIEGTPASQKGLQGTYYILSYEDWNLDDKSSVYFVNDNLKGKPKSITLMKDGVIASYYFENQIGAKIGIKSLSIDSKIEICKAFEEWKPNQ